MPTQHRKQAVVEAGKRVAVSPTEAALMLGISRAKLYELLGSGVLPSIKVGSRRLIPMSAIESMFTEAA